MNEHTNSDHIRAQIVEMLRDGEKSTPRPIRSDAPKGALDGLWDGLNNTCSLLWAASELLRDETHGTLPDYERRSRIADLIKVAETLARTTRDQIGFSAPKVLPRRVT